MAATITVVASGYSTPVTATIRSVAGSWPVLAASHCATPRRNSVGMAIPLLHSTGLLAGNGM